MKEAADAVTDAEDNKKKRLGESLKLKNPCK